MTTPNVPPDVPSQRDVKANADAGDPQAERSGPLAGNMEGLPRRFGKYTLIRKLAVGGMAELFLAIQRSVAGFEKLLVIKRILPAMNQDRAFIDMFLHEARIAATLSHPSIVQIFDVGQVDGTYFIAMEHVHGEDIRSMVRQMNKKGLDEFPLEHAISIVLGVCAGLAYAHEKRDLDGSALNIVHRDISPQNTVVTFSGDVKIVDFGIAKSEAKLSDETRSGRLKGKVPYMSPEQARGEEVDWRSDIFAAGVMLFELTTGKRLFKGPSEYETLKLICEREYPTPSQIREGYPPELEAIVMRALAKDRAARYQSARHMQQDLEDFVRRERIPVSPIALNHFMQSLFEDKLAAQKEALLQGKQLADIIELQEAQEADEGRLSQSILSTPAASRTLTEVNALSALRQRRGALAGVAAAFVVLGAMGGVAWNRHAKEQASMGPGSNGAANGTISIQSDPPGAAIWLNGGLRSDVTPTTAALLPFDRPLEVKLTKEGFESASTLVTLTSGGPSAAVHLALKPGSVSIDVACASGGSGGAQAADCSKMTLNLDGKTFPGSTIDGITAGDVHSLVVSVPGATDQKFSFSGAPFDKKHFDVVLDRAGLAPDAVLPGIATSAASPGPAPHRAARGSTGGSASPAAMGKLNVGAAGGWCNVTVDGVARGATPVAGIDVSAGPHRLACATSDGKSQSATVTVTADGTTRYRFTLGQ
jgi:serine/threonine-protein kinase